jgi:Ni,Fe-hydrogenase maturation factor
MQRVSVLKNKYTHVGHLLYSNGIVEEFKPKGLVFVEEELVSLFTEFFEIKTSRLIDVLNTWCIFGASPVPDTMEFNRIASDICNEVVYSHALFVHDSEINPEWKTADTILYKNYNDFSIEIKKAIDLAATNILKEIEDSQEYEDKSSFLPQLVTIGATLDKRILFGFNPTDQSELFYQNEEFYKFAQKVYDYISHNKQEKEPFTIYADKKAVIIVDTINVNKFLILMLEKFKNKEDYEICMDITKLIKKWTAVNKKPRRKSKPCKEKDNEQ